MSDSSWFAQLDFQPELENEGALNVAPSAADGQGRFMVAARDLALGDVVLRDRPFLCTPSFSLCDWCGNPVAMARMLGKWCTDCNSVVYCCGACREQAQSLHSGPECRLFAQMELAGGWEGPRALRKTHEQVAATMSRARFELEQAKIVREAQVLSRQMARILLAWRRWQQPDARRQDTGSYPHFGQFLLLNDPDPREYPLPDGAVEALPSLYQFLRRTMEAAFGDHSELTPIVPRYEEFFAHYGRLRTNQFGLDDVGGATFLRSSYFNHSCVPNLTYYERGGREIVFWASADIPAGTPLTIHYVSPQLAVEPRRKKLHTTWLFWCHCDLCRLQLRTPSPAADASSPSAGVGEPASPEQVDFDSSAK